jgi:hypothetical protein
VKWDEVIVENKKGREGRGGGLWPMSPYFEEKCMNFPIFRLYVSAGYQIKAGIFYLLFFPHM